MNPLISIIIPVYNVEKYLSRCLDSVVAQTYTNWECLLIDDGSDDSSGLICDEYVLRDSRFRVFHKENGGVSHARNTGIEKMKGEYVCFSDSDDTFEKDSLQIYMSTFEKNTDIDIVRGGYRTIRVIGNSTVTQIDKPIVLEDKEQILLLATNFLYMGFLWNSCIRRSVIGNTRFNEKICWCEDHLFLYECKLKCRKLAYIPNLVYDYYIDDTPQNKSNLSAKIHDYKMIEQCAILDKELKLKFYNGGIEVLNLIQTRERYMLTRAFYFASITHPLKALFFAWKYRYKINYKSAFLSLLVYLKWKIIH